MAISPEYQRYLNSDKWQAKRRKVLFKDGKRVRCKKCRFRYATQVHHLTYKRIFNEPLGDLLAVCAPCHGRIHGIKEKSKRRQIFGSLGKVWAKVMGVMG